MGKQVAYTLYGLFAVISFVVLVGLAVTVMDILANGGWKYVAAVLIVALGAYLVNRLGKRVAAFLPD